MPANPIHHTATVDTPWDGPENEARLTSPVTRHRGNGFYAWHDAGGADPDGDGYPDAKADSKFGHHEVGPDGEPGPADIPACRNIMSRIPQAEIPSADDDGVRAHAQAHMDDYQGDAADGTTASSPRPYGHVSRLLYERPWAVTPQMLGFMAELLTFRANGGRLSSDEIASRLEAARAQNGDRAGAVKAGKVAVIPMYGLLSQRASLLADTSTGGTGLDQLDQALNSALNDKTVAAVVFDIDSPGGAVDGIPEFAAKLRALRAGGKPIVAQVNTLAASAAYWLAASMSEVVITPSGEVGSVGVFAVHEDMSRAADMAGVKTTLISAGKYKVDGNAYEPLTDSARAAIQDQVDAFYGMFVNDVARGRKTSADTVTANYGEGRTLLARQALAAGMVDSIATLEQTVSRLQSGTTASAPARTGAVISPAQLAAAAQPNRPDRAWITRMTRRLR